MRLDHVASGIIHANHDRMRTAVVQRVCDSIADRIGFGIPQSTEGQHVADESGAGTIYARADFVSVRSSCHRRVNKVRRWAKFTFVSPWSAISDGINREPSLR